jgi:hypothetical protein
MGYDVYDVLEKFHLYFIFMYLQLFAPEQLDGRCESIWFLGERWLTYCAAMFLMPWGAPTIIIVRTRVTETITLRVVQRI